MGSLQHGDQKRCGRPSLTCATLRALQRIKTPTLELEQVGGLIRCKSRNVTPIPDVRHITSLTADQDSYLLKFESGVPIEVTLSKDYVITRILTKAPAQTADEHAEYSPSPQGLLLTGIDATNKAPDVTTHFIYDLSYQTVDTFEFPQNIHLIVNDNINMKFSLQSCAVVRATVIKIKVVP